MQVSINDAGGFIHGDISLIRWVLAICTGIGILTSKIWLIILNATLIKAIGKAVHI